MSHSEALVQKSTRRNTLLLLTALVAISLCVFCDQQSKQQGAPKNPSEISGGDGEPPLTLENAQIVSNDGIINMRLVRDGEAKFSSGGYSREIHNVLFIPARDGSPHWLLPDNTHHFADEKEIREKSV